jgi:hypothetical protein
MASGLTPVFITARTLLDVLTYVLDHHSPPTTLIICSTQSTFLQDLRSSLTEDSFLYSPTIALLASSSTIDLAYVPTLPHLRAYISACRSSPRETISFEKPGTKEPMLAIVNSIGLHENTTAFSAQGYGLTIASAVETAVRERMRLMIVEYTESGEQVWTRELPVLNGSGDRLAGRAIELEKVLARWCRYGGIIGDDEEEVEEHEEEVEEHDEGMDEREENTGVIDSG